MGELMQQHQCTDVQHMPYIRRYYLERKLPAGRMSKMAGLIRGRAG